ncbi:MAG: replicative DNA helicase [Lentisphaeria bacterium]|nr:replicative DNA helicase [Lentisphaeria bacterium]
MSDRATYAGARGNGFSAQQENAGPRASKTMPADPRLYDFETERCVLSAILLDSSSLDTVLTVMGVQNVPESSKKELRRKGESPESSKFRSVANIMFQDPVHAVVYEAILSLNANSRTIDLLSVADWLRKNMRMDQIGGELVLLEIQQHAASTAHLESWCKQLKDYAMLREMRRVCASSEELCRGGTESVGTILDKVEADIFNVRNSFVQPEISPLKKILHKTFDELIAIGKGDVEPGIPTGFPDLDKLIGGGLKRGEMFVLAARPSIGKTALALNIIRNIIMKDVEPRRKRVAFFSLEMTDTQIAQRMLCTEARIPITAFYERRFDLSEMPKLTGAVAALRRAELFIDATPGISVYELRAKARKLKAQEEIDLIVIDYLQLMKAGGAEESRQVTVANISGGLKAIAKELNIPVLVLAQLNRETEKGGGGGGKAEKQADSLPKLSNLRESGAIEQDADVVCFIHRNREDSKEGSGKDAITYLIVEKNRNGKTGTVKVQFVKELMEFRCIEHKYDDGDVPKSSKE